MHGGVQLRTRLLIERWASRGLGPKLGQHERLAERIGAHVGVHVDPAPREAQRGLLARAGWQPGVRPEVRGRKVDLRRRVVAQEVAAQLERVERVVRQQVCGAPLALRSLEKDRCVGSSKL